MAQERMKFAGTAEHYSTSDGYQEAPRPRQCPHCGSTDRDHLRIHGTYPRQTPPGTKIRRFLCPVTRRTVSVLPDCFAAHVPGTLEQLEATVRTVEGTGSVTAAARVESVVRQPHCVPLVTVALWRWARRRVRWVAQLLRTVKGLLPERFAGVDPTLEAFARQLHCECVLRELRRVAAAYLQSLPAPLGFRYGPADNQPAQVAVSRQKKAESADSGAVPHFMAAPGRAPP